MLALLANRLETVVSRSGAQSLDIKQSRDLYRDLSALGISCRNLHRWTISIPPTPMCAFFLSNYLHLPEVAGSCEIFDLVKRFLPCEMRRMLQVIAATKASRGNSPLSCIDQGHLADVALQCVKRCMEIRLSLSFGEIAALTGSFDKCGIFTGRFGGHFLEDLMHRSIFLVEEASITEVKNMLPFLFKYQAQLKDEFVQSYIEAISERVIDLIEIARDFDSNCPDILLCAYGTSKVIESLARRGWVHKHLWEAFVFLTKLLRDADARICEDIPVPKKKTSREMLAFTATVLKQLESVYNHEEK